MKAFALRLLALCASTLAVILLAAAFTPPKTEAFMFASRTSEHDTYRRIPAFREWALKGGPEVLVLGASTGQIGIDPSAFEAIGHPTFNLSSAMQTMEVSEVLLEWSLSLGAKHKAVLLDVYPKVWPLSSLASTNDLMVNRPTPLEWPFQKLALRSGNLKTLLNALYFHFRDQLQAPHVWSAQPHGFHRGHTHAAHEVLPVKHFNPKVCQFNEDNLKAFKRLKRRCKDHGIQLILSMPPLPCKTEYIKPEAMKGLSWIAGSDWPLEWVDTLYYDDHHLRGVGAELYSKWLAGEVLALMD
jgi:hypothetical protein